DEHLGEPHDVEPPRIRRVRGLEHLAERVDLARAAPRLLQENAEVHVIPFPGGHATAGAGPGQWRRSPPDPPSSAPDGPRLPRPRLTCYQGPVLAMRQSA